ncbi:hypothetical protein [Agrobacterium vitis]|uniref:hypothetical protein n=1 Tax=Agrobacterium vitis TaxID=373 RepID=UPI0018D239A4|nr:hypothetical protein [Agrobacterium vitis]
MVVRKAKLTLGPFKKTNRRRHRFTSPHVVFFVAGDMRSVLFKGGRGPKIHQARLGSAWTAYSIKAACQPVLARFPDDNAGPCEDAGKAFANISRFFLHLTYFQCLQGADT